jgi:hypothetical protein
VSLLEKRGSQVARWNPLNLFFENRGPWIA